MNHVFPDNYTERGSSVGRGICILQANFTSATPGGTTAGKPVNRTRAQKRMIQRWMVAEPGEGASWEGVGKVIENPGGDDPPLSRGGFMKGRGSLRGVKQREPPGDRR